jgi:integrase
MRAATVLLARLSTPPYKFIPVTIKRDRPEPPTKPVSGYYARYSGPKPNGTRGRIVTPLGSNLETAYAALLNIDTAQKQIRAGQTPSFTGVATMVPAGETLLTDAVVEYLKTCEAIGNSSETIGHKTRALNSFCEVCFANGVSTVDALRDVKTARRVLLAYLSWMKDNLEMMNIDGARPENTRYARMRRLGAFLKQQNIKIKKDQNSSPSDPGLLAAHEFPKYKAKTPTKYSKETMAQWLKTATVDEADLIWFFLATGFRDDEVAHCEWSDLNFRDRTINVHAKTKTAARPWAWMPKDDESRSVDIPLPAEFVKRMEARQKRYAKQNCVLIFPSGVCRPNNNLLRIARRAADRAGITERIELHKIRKTFACYLAESNPVELVRQVLGHSDIATTQLYLSADTSDIRKMKASVNAATDAFGGK